MKTLMWFRRDLRLHDNMALSYASQNSEEVYCVFVFDKNILSKLNDKKDHRVYFIHKSLEAMNEKLSKKEGGIYLVYGDPTEEIPKLARELRVDSVCANRDYEKYAKERDKKVQAKLKSQGVLFHSFKDHVVFESNEIKTKEGTFYKVFTPYGRVWLDKASSTEDAFSERPVNIKKMAFKSLNGRSMNLALTDIGFEETEGERKRDINGQKKLKAFMNKVDQYDDQRDFPSVKGTSELSVYLRFGNLSVRECARALGKKPNKGGQTWLNELIWRDFYSGFLDTHNEIENKSYKYGNVKWAHSKKNLEAWKKGETGVPIVDAGMRQLNKTGWMHNRVRMIVGSYLTKILLIDWKEGERYFGEKLIDYDLASNNGGWQWCASTGTDAVPYFRIFNPYTQAAKFDKEASYIKKFCPELKDLPAKLCHDPTKISEQVENEVGFKLGRDYPGPIMDYKSGRERALKTFKSASGGK